MYNILKISIGGLSTNDVFPQVEHMGEHYRWNDPDSVTRLVSNRPLKVYPNLHSFHLADATNVTDLVSQGYIIAKGLLASVAFCQALVGYVSQDYESFPAEVILRGRSYDYRYLHMTDDIEDRINYKMSVFLLRRADGGVEAIDVPSIDALFRSRVEVVNTVGQALLASKLTFTPGTPILDLFCLTLTGHIYYVSDRLAANLRQRRLTGFELIPANLTAVFQPS